MTEENLEPHELSPSQTPRREFTTERLQKTLEAHERWVRSRGRDGTRAELFEANLGRVDLRVAVLNEANLQGSDLDRALLEGARLQGADLQRASLRGATLQRATLHRANLHGADLFEANLEASALYEANLQAANLLAANLYQADLQQANLQRAFLKQANLHNADLQRANLQGANLQESDLEGAELQGVVLREANLSGANVRGADLQGAELQGCNLQATTLHHANLRDANLFGVIGLTASQLAGCNVAGAQLPETVRTFDGLSTVRALTKQARRLFHLLFLVSAFAWLSITATTDTMLLTNAPVALFPNLITPIPSTGFYMVLPAILLGLFIYFHLHLQRLWEELAALPAVFPDGRSLDRTVYPWLLHGLVRVHSLRLWRHRLPLSHLQSGICTVLIWWLVPITLLFFWARYLPRQQWAGTLLHIALLVGAIGFAVLFSGLARTALCGRPLKRYKHGAVALLVAFIIDVLLSLASLGVLTGVPPHLYTTRTPQLVAIPRLDEIDIRRLIPRLFTLIGYNPFADLTEVEVSTRLIPDAGLEEVTLTHIKGASLRQSSLRYANAAGAFLINADLRGADLVGANLRHADLRGAKLTGADLRGANLHGADLRHASGLTQAQISTALYNDTTRLPEAIDMPGPAPLQGR